MKTEELLMRLRRAAEGEEPRADVAPLVDQVVMFTTLTLHRFSADENPEMPAETRETITDGLKAYLETLGRVRAALNGEDELGPLLDETQERVNAVRAAQLAHQAQLAQGPTVFPFLNRLLLPSPNWEALKQEAPGFLQWVRSGLRVRTVSPVDAQVVVKLQEALEALPQVDAGQLSELAHRLAAILAEPPREERSGPTPIASINGVLAALDDRENGDAFVLQHLTECRLSLRQAVPVSSSADLLGALQTVLATLDQLERAVREKLEFEEVLMAAFLLENHANSLADIWASSQAPAGDICFVKGLPALFQSVLDAGTDFLAGRIDGDTVLEASEHLELAVGQMQRQTEAVKDARVNTLAQAYEMLREAAESLRALAATGDAGCLEIASSLCVQADEIINSMATKS